MEYLKAEEKHIKECQVLKNEVIKRLREQNLDIWNEEYPSDKHIEEDILSGAARIVTENDEIIAFAALYKTVEEFGEEIFKHENLFSFSRLMVKTGFEGKHVATFLIKSMLEEAKNRGAAGCGIMVHPINPKAIKMYENLGFKFEQRKLYPYGDFMTYSLIFEKNHAELR